MEVVISVQHQGRCRPEEENVIRRSFPAIPLGRDPFKRQEVEAVMRGLGFERFEDYRHWLHPHIQIPVEFPPGPLQTGHLLVQGVNEIIIGKTKLKILKVEDILIDRLIMAHEWKDLQAQAQAEMLMYAHYSKIDWSNVHQKASQVGLLKLFRQIERKVKKRMKNR